MARDDVTRRRTQGNNLLRESQTEHYYNSPPSTTQTGGFYGLKREMSDVVSANFYNRSQRGEIINSPMTKRLVSRSFSPGSAYYGYPTATPANWARFWGDWSSLYLQVAHPWELSRTLIGDAELTALEREVCTRVQSQRNRINSDQWENIAEARRTLELLWIPVQQYFLFERVLRNTHRRNYIRRGRQVLVNTASLWLAYRYGVRPLINSVEELLKSFRKSLRPVRKTTRSSNSLMAQSNTVQNFTYSQHNVSYRIQKTETHQVRAMSLDEVGVDTLLPKYGFGSKNLMTLPWELVPYGFVVDWFVNVGDYLGAVADVFYPGNLGECYVGTQTLSEVRTSLSDNSTNPSLLTVASPYLCTVRNDTVNQGRVPALLSPSLVVKSDFRLDQAIRLADAFSLIGTSLAGIFIRK